MELDFNGRRLQLPSELINHICSYLDNNSDACATRLVSRSFAAAATPLIIDIWDSPSLLFVKPDRSNDHESYGGTGIDPNSRPPWVEKPVTVWTWMEVPTDVTLELESTVVGEEFRKLLYAPNKSRYDHDRTSFERYGRKGLSWGRIQEDPELLCIVTQWDSHQSWATYRDSEEADALRKYLNKVAPNCISSSSSEYISLVAGQKRHCPLFGGYHEIRTIYFKSEMTRQQREKFDMTRHLYREPHRVVFRGKDHLFYSPWWWLPGLRRHKGNITLTARFAFNWQTAEHERFYQDTETRRPGPGEDLIRATELFERELQAAGAVDVVSLHCDFIMGPWRN